MRVGNLQIYQKTVGVTVESAAAELPPSGIVILGNFDGVHRGHQSLFEVAKDIAQKESLPILVLTFDPPPQVFFQLKDFQKIQSLSQKLLTFESYGIRHCALLTFNEALSLLSPADFVEQLLIGWLQAKHVVVGSDFRFGRARRGAAMELQGWARQFTAHVIPPLCFEGRPISSTWIRTCLREGNPKLAGQLLGRPFSYQGKVVPGQQKGRLLGFPTANIEVPADFLVKGVYFVEVRWAHHRYWAVANIGSRPTLKKDSIRCDKDEGLAHPSQDMAPLTWLEVHILGYNGDLYGTLLEVYFLEKLREERAFETVDALKEQLVKDVETAKLLY